MNPAGVALASGSAPVVALDAWPWGLATAAVAAGCALGIQWAAGSLALRPLFRGPRGHWTETARLAYPGWVALALGQIFYPLVWMCLVHVLAGWRQAATQRWMTLFIGLSAFAGTAFPTRRLESLARGYRITIQDWLRSWTVIGIFFFAPMLVFSTLLLSPEEQLTATHGWMIAGCVLVLVILDFGGSLALARALGLLLPAPERLQAIARSVGPCRRLYVLRWKMANALAFPPSQAIAFTEPALACLTDEELATIYAHEKAHLDEPLSVSLARLVSQLRWMPLFLILPLAGSFGPAGILLAFSSFVLAQSLTQRLTLAMEVRADTRGRAQEVNQGTYARALERLYQANLSPAVTRQTRPTHPHLYDRLVAAGITPDYPRPELPSRWRARAAALCGVVATVLCILSWFGILQAIGQGSIPTP